MYQWQEPVIYRSGEHITWRQLSADTGINYDTLRDRRKRARSVDELLRPLDRPARNLHPAKRTEAPISLSAQLLSKRLVG